MSTEFTPKGSTTTCSVCGATVEEKDLASSWRVPVQFFGEDDNYLRAELVFRIIEPKKCLICAECLERLFDDFDEENAEPLENWR